MTRGNALPEGIVYQDTGCEVAPACLSCPLPLCIHEPREIRQQEAYRQRAQEIQDLLSSGVPPQEIAARLRISRRTFYRALQKVTR